MSAIERYYCTVEKERKKKRKKVSKKERKKERKLTNVNFSANVSRVFQMDKFCCRGDTNSPHRSWGALEEVIRMCGGK